MRSHRAIFVAVFACLVAACGGGGGESAPQDSGVASDAAALEVATDSVPDAIEPPIPLRWEISPERPFFVFNVYMGTTSEDIDNLAAMIPTDVLPYFGVQLVGLHPYDDVPSHRQWIEEMVDACTVGGIPTFAQADTWNTASDIPMSFYEDLFERSPLFLGMAFAEFSANGLTIDGMTADNVQRVVRAVETVAPYGGFLLWQDMGWEWSGLYPESGHPFVEAGSEPLLTDLFLRLGRHVILQDKHNGTGKRFQGPAAIMGWWASGLVGAWGVASEDWLWWEAGWGPLFGEHGRYQKAYDAQVARWNYPLAMTGQAWLVGLAGGASVFSVEVGYANAGFSDPSPAFLHVHLPFMRHVIGQRVLVSREELLETVRVAYLPAGPWGWDMHNDEIFRGLYGPEVNSLFEWLPSTGRYSFMPVLPTLLADEVTALFHEVVGTGTWETEWKDAPEAKAAWFDARYPPVDGDAWFLNVGDRWFLTNPNENTDVTTTFAFPLRQRPCLVFSGSIEPHWFGFVTETDGGLEIRMSNYRIDGQGMLDAFGAEIEAAYHENPWDDVPRHTTFRIEGMAGPPEVETDGSRPFTFSEDFVSGAWSAEIDHNGFVAIDLAFSVECR